MKAFVVALSVLCLVFSSVMAEENDQEVLKSDVEDLAERLNVVKPEQYVEMTKPVRDYAHQTALKLTPQEVALINSAQKRINRDFARRQGTVEKRLIELNAENKQQIEDFLTPPMYTYDDIQ